MAFTPIDIHVEYELLHNLSIYKYARDVLMPPAVDYFKYTLKVQSKGSISIFDETSLCDLEVNERYLEYPIKGDLIILMTADSHPDATYVAYAEPCGIASNGRPLVAHVFINTAQINPDDEDLNEHTNYYIQVMLHELIHALGFSSAFFPSYPGAEYDNVTY
mmetsp:Transcript_40006/g.35693  ORF Transcript_40006/g.35693 Transcript_40006/m.35693 type:complete len:162 (+) Transcript_40006:165-650(+)|eukprot:CAMPEP_0114575452 /NCGR_PEP_ID=MMETSP0125-20121206/318_1 /TAXON_ID=485358 ORGANISM="Aristerostoma sp., Strain ATCC 50986" /NCGR_SAMPLE_ID=MMETSP0125 /ASSEMBLY_ACC=CAM_ASM_000245 /LENGTH=161 /DNA_ID=CAMNT_0001763189 /DNA_START=93 /DNA_END=578 /DNA_ORIENTATION=-